MGGLMETDRRPVLTRASDSNRAVYETIARLERRIDELEERVARSEQGVHMAAGMLFAATTPPTV